MKLPFRLLILILPLVASCAQPPTATMETARRSGQQAFEAKANIYVPRAYKEYEYALARARRFQMEEDSWSVPLFRDYSRTVEAYRLAVQKGDDARRLSLEEQQKLAELATKQIDQAEFELTETRILVNGVPVGRPSAAILSEAEILIREAQRLLAAQEFVKARKAADRAIEKVGLVDSRAGLVLDRFKRPDLLEKWRKWVQETVEWSRKNDSYSIVVDKSRHTCTVFYQGKAKKSYAVNLGVNGFNQKYRAGDLATPEGRYQVIRKQDLRESRYYKGLLLNYPNEEDWQRFNQAKQDRFISTGSNIGGLIMLHGDGRKNVDWTQGCVALDNRDIDELFPWVEVGTPVVIIGRDTSSFATTAKWQEDVVVKTQEKVTRRNGRMNGG